MSMYEVIDLGTSVDNWWAVGVTDNFEIVLGDGHEDIVQRLPQKTFIGAGWIRRGGGVIEIERWAGNVNIPVLKMVDAHAIKVDLEEYLGGRAVCRR